jgi:hypothetical protein
VAYSKKHLLVSFSRNNKFGDFMRSVSGLIIALLICANCYSQVNGVLSVNRVSLPLNNAGSLAEYQTACYDSSAFLYSGGFAFSGISSGNAFVNGVMPSLHIYDYRPGKTGDSLNQKNVLYSVAKSDPVFGPSWQKWKDAVELGAEFYDGNNDGIYNPVDLNGNGKWDTNEDRPVFYGDKNFWCVYSDGEKSSNRVFTNMMPQGVEIRQTVFAFNRASDTTDNAVYVKYSIKNSSNNNWDSCCFSLFADVDLTSMQDNAGTDAALKSITAYAKNNGYPACFITNLQAPVQYIPGITFTDVNSNGVYDGGIDISLDTAYAYTGRESFRKYPGARNISDYSTFYFVSGDAVIGDPAVSTDLINYESAKLKSGLPLNPCTFGKGTVNGGALCDTINPKYIFSGNPVSNYGWLQKNPDGIYQLLNISPFTLRAQESKDLIFAYVLGKGDTWPASYTSAENHTQMIKRFFSQKIAMPYSGVESSQVRPSDFRLMQNFPNPFNPGTTISCNIPAKGYYTLKVYDMLGREVALLNSKILPAGEHSFYFDAKNKPSGIYIYRLTGDNVSISKKMMLVK